MLDLLHRLDQIANDHTAAFGAVGAWVGFAFWGRPAFAVGAASIALVAQVLQGTVIPAHAAPELADPVERPAPVRRFRQIHSTVLLVILLQLVAIVWGILRLAKP